MLYLCMSDIVYVLENRGSQYITHWFFYMIAGLKDLYKIQEQPVKIHFQGIQYDNLIPYQQETIKAIHKYFEYIDDPSPYQQVRHHGAPLVRPDLTPQPFYFFLKQLMDDAFPYDYSIQPTRRVYISRNGGVARRHIMNEPEVYEILHLHGFEYIRLEDLNLYQKIQLFREAKIIVSPNGAGLVMAHWAHPSTHIVEIHDSRTSGEDHHFNTCRILNIRFSRYTNVHTVDEHRQPMMPYLTGPYNFILHNLEDFSSFITQTVSSS
jgi:capsular polysaccharide biosynthesis protein